ncbi:Hsp20/alpha crystallin family protein [Nanoarchaeota archaeon]
MGFFDEDPFEDLFKDFFGGTSPKSRKYREQIIQGEEEDRTIDFLEDEKKIYFIFELSGYNESDIIIEVNKNILEIKASKKNCDIENVQDYLSKKLCNGLIIKKTLPNFINSKKFSNTMKNGVLEVIFNKK